MGSRALASTILLSLQLLFFTLVTSSYVHYAPPSPKSYEHHDVTKPSLSPANSYENHDVTKPSPSSPNSHHYDYPKPHSPAKLSNCPKNVLKLGVCTNVLKNLLEVKLGESSNKMPCCSLIQDLVDLEAAVCLCTALKANVLGIKLDVPISLDLLLNHCGKEVPYGFLCA